MKINENMKASDSRKIQGLIWSPLSADKDMLSL
jgi:hypothetical protein